MTDILRDEKLLPMFRQAGLVHVSLGTEAAAQLKLDRFNKETTIEQNKEAIRLLREAGIVSEAQFIVGLENETAGTLEEPYRMARDWNPDMANWAMYTPWPFSDLFEVLPVRVGRTVTAQVFEAAGLIRYLQEPPQAMVDEAEVRRLHGVLRETLGDIEARAVALAAGTRTADYLLAHRIPRPVQRLLKGLPAALAARVLLAAIARHAWTFAGSGAFSARCAWRRGPPLVPRIRGSPLSRGLATPAPACDFYAATFERLFQVLVHARAGAGSRLRGLRRARVPVRDPLAAGVIRCGAPFARPATA